MTPSDETRTELRAKQKRVCTLDGCQKPHLARGMCAMHYQRATTTATEPKVVDSLPGEIWKPVVGFEGYYRVSSLGRVESVERVIPKPNGTQLIKRRLMKQGVQPNGYLRVNLWKDGKQTHGFVHRLVAEAFIRSPEHREVACHNDGDPLNNTAENLRWDTPKENSQDILRHGRNPRANQTHCKRGHEFTPENTRIRETPSGGVHRKCLECSRIRESNRLRRKRSAA